MRVLRQLIIASQIGLIAGLSAADTLPEYPPLKSFNSILERPLFNSSRRPRIQDEPVKVQGAGADAVTQRWQLAGVVLQQGEMMALFRNRESGGYQRLAQGMQLEQSWRLEEVGPDYVRLSTDTESLKLPLWRPRHTRTPPSPTQTRATSRSSGQTLKPQTTGDSAPGSSATEVEQ